MRNAIILTAALAGAAHADTPQMGGPMSHLLVSVFDQQVFVGFESPSLSSVELRGMGSTFDGAAGVLDRTGHNAQFGWLANGFISLPPGSGVFVERVSSSPHLSVYEEFTFDPILGTDGSSDVWRWDGSMTHNWYASDVYGPHSATYEVFVGDALGNALAGWGSASVELNFEFGPASRDTLAPGVRIGTGADPSGRVITGGAAPGVAPAPGAAGALAMMAIGASARRRR